MNPRRPEGPASGGRERPGVPAQLGDLADWIADIVLVLDGEQRILAANRACRELIGRDPEGEEIAGLLGGDAHDAHRQAILAARAGVREFEAPILVREGQPAGFLWVAAPGPDGTVALAGRDMTHVYGLDLIRHLSADLDAKQRRLEVVGEINRALARSLDFEEASGLVAREAGRLLPLDYLQVAHSTSSRELHDLHLFRGDGCEVHREKDRPWAGADFELAWRERRPRIRPTIRGAAGALGAASALDLPVVLDDLPLGVLSFLAIRDNAYRAGDPGIVGPVIGQYAAALANARLIRGLEDANRAKRELIQIASHEINTPLTVIKGMSSVLAAGGGLIPAERTNALLKAIDAQADRLGRLVADLLLVSQLEAGRIELYLTPVDLPQLVRDTAASVVRGFEGREWRLAPAGPAAVKQDANQLVRCLTHLLSNAFKFSEADAAVEIGISSGPSGYEIAICNAVAGLTDAELEGIFEKFGRLARHQSSHEGAGLGLYTTRLLARRLGGDVRASASADRGATFTLVVPDLEPAGATGN